MGLRFAAFMEGSSPNTRPITVENATAAAAAFLVFPQGVGPGYHPDRRKSGGKIVKTGIYLRFAAGKHSAGGMHHPLRIYLPADDH